MHLFVKKYFFNKSTKRQIGNLIIIYFELQNIIKQNRSMQKKLLCNDVGAFLLNIFPAECRNASTLDTSNSY